jgi:hypothetical protein
VKTICTSFGIDVQFMLSQAPRHPSEIFCSLRNRDVGTKTRVYFYEVRLEPGLVSSNKNTLGFCRLMDEHSPYEGRRIVGDQINFNVMKSWVDKCIESSRQLGWLRGLAPGFRLYDVQQQCVTKMVEHYNCVALTYV